MDKMDDTLVGCNSKDTLLANKYYELLSNKKIRARVLELLLKLGVHPQHDGFEQLCSVVILQTFFINNTLRSIYKVAAKFHNVQNEPTITRNISRAIKNSTTIAIDLCNLIDLTGYDQISSTNVFIISSISTHFKITGKLDDIFTSTSKLQEN